MIGKKDAKETIVEEGTAFKGSFASDCPIIVRGRIEGEISGPSLTVSSTGAVNGKVKVTELRCDGELEGDFEAESVILTGKVKDNTVIRARKLEVKLAPDKGAMQVVFGECEIEAGDVPDKADAIVEAEMANAEAAAAVAEAEAVNDGPPTDPPPAADDGSGDTADASSGNDNKGGSRKKRGNKGRTDTVPPPAE